MMFRQNRARHEQLKYLMEKWLTVKIQIRRSRLPLIIQKVAAVILFVAVCTLCFRSMAVTANRSITVHGAWTSGADSHTSDDGVQEGLLQFFKNERVKNLADFGCGNGAYAKHFNENGIKTQCYDGNVNTPNMTNGRCEFLDLAFETKFSEPFDWILSLEVGEHIPAKFEDVYIQNLHRNNANGIILSWYVLYIYLRAFVQKYKKIKGLSKDKAAKVMLTVTTTIISKKK